MKKVICLAVILVAVFCCITGCNFTSNLTGFTAMETAKVENMMTLLTNNQMSEAISLIHPSVAQGAEDELEQMSLYLAGRKVVKMVQTGSNLKTSSGTSGKVQQEQATFQVELDDNTVIYLSVTYLSDKDGMGFTAFQIVLGVV